MNLTHLFKTNAFIFSFYITFFHIGGNIDFFSVPGMFLGFLVILISGFNFAVIVKILFKKGMDIWELITFSFLAIMLFYPLVLSFEFMFFKKIYYFLPLANSFFIFAVLFLLAKAKKLKWSEFIISIPKIKIREALSSPLSIVFIIQLAVVITIFSAYDFLPDKDPFKWLFRLSDLFEKNILSPETYRPFFSGITFIFTQITGLSMFYFFKYIIPLLSLSMIFPMWLVARNMKNKMSQFLMLLTVFITPNVILYSETAMPQVFAIFLTYYFIAFLLLYNQTKISFFYFVAGIISFFSIFFHEISTILFLIWIMTAIFLFRKKIISNKRDIIYIVLLVISNLALLRVDFISFWIKKFFLLLKKIKINLMFPAHYTNIDHNEMGWTGFFGVSKFYSYYVGPVILFILLSIIYYFIVNKDFKYYLKETFKKGEIILLFGCFFIFFTISEILPRAINLSMLPDRSWVFGGIFSVLFLYIIINYLEQRNSVNKIFYSAFLIAVLIVISGAVYVNYQKRNLITKNQMESAVWIRENLPSERIFVSSAPASIIKYYSRSDMIAIPNNFYNDERFIELFAGNNQAGPISEVDLSEYAKKIKENYEELSALLNEKHGDLTQKSKTSLAIAKENIQFSKEIISQIGLLKNSTLRDYQNVYIYYSEKSKENPYSSRPYEIKRNPEINEFIFDKHPQKFKKIYEKNGNDRVIIWKVL